MRMDKAYCQRNFGTTKVKVDHQGKIKILGKTYHISGHINPAAISDVKRYNWLPDTDPEQNLIKLESKVTSKLIFFWLYNRVLAGKFDHLLF